jgi:hypothetical protein
MGSRKSWRVCTLAAAATALLTGCGSSSATSGSGAGGGSSTAVQSGGLNIGVIAPFTGPAAQFGKLLGSPCYAATDLINKAAASSGTRCIARRSMTPAMPPTPCPT